jgi:hypothetical protein
MLRRYLIRASVLAGALAVLGAGGAHAGPAGKLTIHVVPGQTIAGEAVLIYGALNGPDHAGQRVVLHQRIAPATTFGGNRSVVTTASGQYEFTLGEGIVMTDRSWYVTGPAGLRSPTRSDHVAALLSLTGGGAGETNHPLTFTGHVMPGLHVGELVLLQKQVGSGGNSWKEIAHATIGAGSNFSIPHTFRTPGAFTLRAWLPNDGVNVSAASDALGVVIQQAEDPDFTIQTGASTIDEGQSTAISGTLYAEAPGHSPLPGASVRLWAHAHGAGYALVGSTVTARDGSYAITVTPEHNEVYEARTSFGTHTIRRTAQLFESVRPAVTVTASSPTSAVDGSVAFSGSVNPAKPRAVIDLEQLGSHGAYHIVESGLVNGSSTYTFDWTFGNPGSKRFRVAVPGGPDNATGISPVVTIDVSTSPTPPTTSTGATTTTAAATTTPETETSMVTVTTGAPGTFTFTLSTASQPKVVSDVAKTELLLPPGEVTFQVSDPVSNILSYDFEVCSSPLPGPVTTLGSIQTLPNSCSGSSTPVLTPGGSVATLTLDLPTPGTYEYLSTVGGSTGDAFSGMKGVLNVSS